jgi:hypothetical protein
LQGVTPAFAHGYVRFYVGNNIVKLAPATGTVTNATIKGVIVTVTEAGGLVWNNKDLYHHDSITKKLFKIGSIDDLVPKN